MKIFKNILFGSIVIGWVALIGVIIFDIFDKPEQVSQTFRAQIVSAAEEGANGAQNAQGNTNCGNDNWTWSIGSATVLQTNDTSYAQQTTNRWDDTDVGDQLDALDFGFSIPTGSSIEGITVVIYGWSPTANTIDFTTVQLTTDSGSTLIGTNQASGAGATLSTSDDNSTDTFGAADDNWGDVVTVAQINSSSFGVSTCWTMNGNDGTANIDLVEMTITYTPSAGFDTNPFFMPSIF